MFCKLPYFPSEKRCWVLTLRPDAQRPLKSGPCGGIPAPAGNWRPVACVYGSRRRRTVSGPVTAGPDWGNVVLGNIAVCSVTAACEVGCGSPCPVHWLSPSELPPWLGGCRSSRPLWGPELSLRAADRTTGVSAGAGPGHGCDTTW